MHIILDGVELEVDSVPSARAADLVAGGFWLDRRFHPPTGQLELYEGAAVTTSEAPVEASTAYVLDIIGGLRSGRSFPMPRRHLTVGRAPECDIVLDDPTVSPRHAEIDEHHRVRDLDSLNGTSIDGDLIRFGATQARVRPARNDQRRPGSFNRPPRPQLPPQEPPPDPPAPLERARSIGIAAIVGPALMGGALVLIYGDLRYALIALVGPVVASFTWFGAKRTARKQGRRHRHAMRVHERDSAAHRERERQRLELLAPDPTVMTRQLWARRPHHDDFGLVRLGLRGAMPVVADGLAGTIGITGDRGAALSLARSLVCQAAAHHGPADVGIALDEGDGDEWDWAKWLPHPSTASATFRVAIAMTEDELPASCTTVVHMTSDLGDVDNEFIACGMDERTARTFARRLARFVDPEIESSTSLPTSIALSGIESEIGVPIGVGVNGVVEIDLVRDGPHGLIAGTTGSGKSELLRTLVVGLARRHTPDEMVFVLVDYKGGSAFDDCARLPHCVGLVTDLDEHLGGRALRSLEAELRYRERADRAGSPSLPRLVVVVDEFATLAAELPDFLGALVGIAQRGRSLGMHLLLATQRPAGAVSANIKANTNLRIALRVQDASDSIDVIDGPRAATIGRATPGRAYIRRGSGDVVLVQTALSSVVASTDRPPVRVRPFPCHDDDQVAEGPTELSVLVRELQHWTGRAPRRPWLPMLADQIELDQIERPGFAVADEPDHQRHVAVGWDPSDGNLALFGRVGSGTTTAMRAAVERLDDAHVYEIDFGRDCRERHARLMRMLRIELDRRRICGSVEPLMVTCVDDVGAFLAEHDSIDGVEVTESFHRLFAEGPEFGIAFIVTATRVNALPMRSASLVSQKLLFRLADPQEYASLGLRPKDVPTFVPGRAIHSNGNRVVQVGMPHATFAPRTIRTLPRQIQLADLPPGAIGIDEDLEPVWLTAPEHLLITGPPRSGKTTALQTMASVLTTHVFVDDAARLDAIDLGQRVVAAARTDDVRGGYGHWLREIRKSRTGLLLHPDLSSDGDLLGARLPRRLAVPMVPGRGFLVENGEARLVQIATAGP